MYSFFLHSVDEAGHTHIVLSASAPRPASLPTIRRDSAFFFTLRMFSPNKLTPNTVRQKLLSY